MLAQSLWSIHPEVIQVGCIVVSFLIFSGPSYWFHQDQTSYIPIRNLYISYIKIYSSQDFLSFHRFLFIQLFHLLYRAFQSQSIPELLESFFPEKSYLYLKVFSLCFSVEASVSDLTLQTLIQSHLFLYDLKQESNFTLRVAFPGHLLKKLCILILFWYLGGIPSFPESWNSVRSIGAIGSESIQT